jgi:2,3-diaminopropionate biosynthesis protein SbnA
MELGHIGLGSVVVESSSGNMGVGLAQVCSYYGIRFICVVDPRTTPQNIRHLEAYGAEVDVVTEPNPVTGEFLQARLDRVKALLQSIRGSYLPDQYSNEYNPRAHHRTMQEIAAALDQRVDYVFYATSTCGTLRGCAEYVRDNGLSTTVIAVDAVGSVVFGSERRKRLIPGHGAACRPALYQPGLAPRCLHVTDLDCIIGCRRLARREAILAGGSSGAVFMALEQIKDDLLEGSTCVMIFGDRGERYLDTIYSDAWVTENFGRAQACEGPCSQSLSCGDSG